MSERRNKETEVCRRALPYTEPVEHMSSAELEEIGRIIEQLDSRCEATDREVAAWQAGFEQTKKSAAGAMARVDATLRRLDRYDKRKGSLSF